MRAQQFQEKVWDQVLTEGEVFFMYIWMNVIGKKIIYLTARWFLHDFLSVNLNNDKYKWISYINEGHNGNRILVFNLKPTQSVSDSYWVTTNVVLIYWPDITYI